MGKPRDTKIAILPSTTRKGTTLSTSAALDSPSVIDKLVSPPHASRAGTSAESENSHNIDNVSAVLDDSGSLGSFLDATIAKSRQIENTETPNATTPVKSPELDYSSDDPDEDYVELDDDFIEKCNATTDARKIKKLLAEHAVRYKPSPDPKFATSPINIRDKDYDFSLDLSHIAIVEKTPFCGTEKESAVEHLTELSTLSGVFSDDVKMRTYFVAKIFPFSLKDDAKTWYNNLPPGSIKSPTDLRDVFFRKYFPASAQHAALQRIYNFDQEDGEKLPEAWARFCSLIRAQPDHDLEKHDLLDIFYSGLTIESRAYLDSCAGCVFRKRTPEDAEELLAKIGRNHDDWSTPEPTPTPIVKKRGMIKLNDEDMREAKKSLKEKGIKPEDVKNLPPIEDICETIPPSSMIEYMKDIVTNKRKIPNEEISTMLANYSFNGKIPKKLGDPDKLIPTDISLQMADKSTAIPVGLCENVPVQVTQHCLILTDFVVLEMPEDDNMSIILGRPFLNTAGAVIDCNKGMVTFNVDDKEHTVYFPKRIDKDFEFHRSRTDPMVRYKIYNKTIDLPFSDFCTAIRVPQWGSCEKIRGTPRELSDLYTRICNGRSFSNDGGLLERDIFDLFLPEFDKPWVIHLRETCTVLQTSALGGPTLSTRIEAPVDIKYFLAPLPGRKDKTLLDTTCSGSFTSNKEEFKRDLLDRIKENAEDWENDKGKESGYADKPPFKPLPPKEGEEREEEKKKKKGTKKKKKKKKKENKKKEVTAYPRVNEITLGSFQGSREEDDILRSRRMKSLSLGMPRWFIPAYFKKTQASKLGDAQGIPFFIDKVSGSFS
ncbi:hypothetical protein QYE76_059358 [Lolium multiflorum]|uniref:Retrotransposon gag domain-containing protein n=1 Tax=Lolium multiflorum TaxID=4521 RepID=A0AAD8W394_LOLMU|nr:hypothetical protein QYE76_059358 [Lolium multiflorum]